MLSEALEGCALVCMAGHCVVCTIEGQDEEDFLCEGCVDLGQVLVICAGCRARYDGTPAVLDVIERFTGLPFPRRGGVTIKLSHCFACGNDGPVRTQVFGVRLPGNG